MGEDQMNLKQSREVVGYLYPVLVDARGRVIDGHHRIRADPKWPKRRVGARTEKDRILLRIHANHVRRSVTLEERRADFEALAKELEKEGVTPDRMVSEVARLTCLTPRWVRELLPDRYKAVEKRRKTHEEATSSSIEVPVRLPPEVVERFGGVEGIGEKIRSMLEPRALERPRTPQQPAPEPVFTGEDWECPICGAEYRMFHVGPSEHRFDMARAGKDADH